MKQLRLVIFNEPYWDKGLIYSQNILPLLQLKVSEGYKLSIISFTSVVMLLLKRRVIKKCKAELKQKGIRVYDFPVLFYPTRFMYLRWALLPFYFLNVYFYIKYWALRDKKKENLIYSIRSYQAALGFCNFYPYPSRIVFDLRTDWIEENINRGLFCRESRTVKYWMKKEKEMLLKFKKSLFISPVFKDNVLQRHHLLDDMRKFIVSYNPIDYNHFKVTNSIERHRDFLYTGSLGHWNNIEAYLKFFLAIHAFFPDSKLIVCTNSPQHKVNPSLNKVEYDEIRKKVEIHYNVSYNILPKYYARCTYGLQIMNKRDSRVGVKFIEYIAAGILPIVHVNVQGAAKLVEQFHIGVNISDEDFFNGYNLANRIRAAGTIDATADNYKLFQSFTDINMIKNKMQEIYG